MEYARIRVPKPTNDCFDVIEKPFFTLFFDRLSPTMTDEARTAKRILLKNIAGLIQKHNGG
jgi:hypothetical protein